MINRDNLPKGDSGYIAEELLKGVSRIEEKSRAITQAVGEGYFSLEEALKVYDITEEEYKNYNMKQERRTTRVA